MHIESRAFGLLAAIAVASACGTKDAPTGLDGGDQGRVRFVNLITNPARNPVNAILEGMPFGVGLAYTAATPPTLPAPATALYSPVLVGPRTLVVKRTADTAVTLATISFTVASNEDQTIYATGGTGTTAVTNFITTDANSTAPATTEVRFRVVNLSPTAGPVDVFVTAAGADLAAATPNAVNVASQSASAYFAVSLPPNATQASYVIRFVPAGTAAAARNASVSITIAAATYVGGTGRTIVATENAAGTGVPRGFVLTDR
jgi:hypothetical protein